jgi:hypothetical protein
VAYLSPPLSKEEKMKIDIEWRGLALVPSRSAAKELYRLNMSLVDVEKILHEGYDCSRSRRKKGTYEICKKRGNKTIKIVLVKTEGLFSKRDEFLITHVGEFTRRK